MMVQQPLSIQQGGKQKKQILRRCLKRLKKKHQMTLMTRLLSNMGYQLSQMIATKERVVSNPLNIPPHQILIWKTKNRVI